MTQAISIHVGVNRPQGRHEANLVHSEASAWRMAQVAKQAGFQSMLVLRGAWATRAAVAGALQRAAEALEPEGNLLVTFSGHGCEQADMDMGALRERSGMDEGWCLHDGTLLDDELLTCWRRFKPGVRIVVVSESCHSGDVGRDEEDLDFCRAAGATLPPRGEGTVYRDGTVVYADGTTIHRDGTVERPDGTTHRPGGASSLNGDTYRGGAGGYGALCVAKPVSNDGIAASLLLLAACQARQKAGDGLFSCHLLSVWDGGAFEGSYCELHHRIRERVMGDRNNQEPNIMLLGSADPAFAMEKAFHVRPVVYRSPPRPSAAYF
jgi:hypothetical protein